MKYTTIQDEEMRRQKENQELYNYLYSVGYYNEGVYILTFPNGKSYVGYSKRLGNRLKEIFASFKLGYGKSKWIEKAIEENGKLSFKEIEVKIKASKNYKEDCEKEKERLRKNQILLYNQN